MIAETSQSFIDGIIYDFIDKVMESSEGSGANIHSGSLTNSIQSFQNLDLIGTILIHFLCTHISPSVSLKCQFICYDER